MALFDSIARFFANWGAQLASTFLEKQRYLMLVDGLRNTLIITLGALAIGVAIGALIAIIKYCGEGSRWMKPLCFLCDLYTTVIRGIPASTPVPTWRSSSGAASTPWTTGRWRPGGAWACPASRRRSTWCCLRP